MGREVWIAPDGSRTVLRDVFDKCEDRLITYGAGAEEMWITPGKSIMGGRVEVWGGGVIGRVDKVQEGSPSDK